MATQTQVLKRAAVQPARLHDYLYGSFCNTHKTCKEILLFRPNMYTIRCT